MALAMIEAAEADGCLKADGFVVEYTGVSLSLVGAGFVVPLWQQQIADQIELVSTQEAAATSAHLAREEGLFGGNLDRRKRSRGFAIKGRD
jgi:cysteine synthase